MGTVGVFLQLLIGIFAVFIGNFQMQLMILEF